MLFVSQQNTRNFKKQNYILENRAHYSKGF